MEVSCVVPVKNGLPYIEECLRSLLDQTFQGPWEICIYDDGSVDNTLDALQKFIPLFASRNVVLRIDCGLESRGVGFAKNRAVQMSEGRFICFCDADDISVPSRIQDQYDLASSSGSDLIFIGSNFWRLPKGSTERYTSWANGLSVDQLSSQVFTSHGPTLVAPTWFISRELYKTLKGFKEVSHFGFPEDLEFFYRALDLNAVFFSKVEKALVMYRYHRRCASFDVPEITIWNLRVDRFRRKVLPQWSTFTIWNAGKQGKRFFRSLLEEEKGKVLAFCDVDEKKIRRAVFEEYDENARIVRWRLPIMHVRDARPPVVICVKLDMTGGDLERLVSESGWREGCADGWSCGHGEAIATVVCTTYGAIDSLLLQLRPSTELTFRIESSVAMSEHLYPTVYREDIVLSIVERLGYSNMMVFEPVHPDEQKFVDTALNLVQEAGRLVRDAFDQPTTVVKTKASETDLVTETDQAVEKLLIEGLSTAFPDHKFIGEESTAGGAKIEYTDAPTWIIDPIDGTTNFVHRIPLIAICVGLSINKQLRAGIVYNPVSRELFFAQAGCGAFKNGFPIHVSNTTALNRSLVMASLAIHNYHRFGGEWLDIAQGNMRRQVEAGIRGHRCFGSAAINMMMVAQGACDAMVEYGLHSWDVAAAAVIVLEAGGCIIDPTGGPFNVMSRKVLCASTEELAMSLSKILTHADYEPEG